MRSSCSSPEPASPVAGSLRRVGRWAFGVIALLSPVAVWAGDLFAPFLDAGPPVILRTVADPARDAEAGPGVQVRRVVFRSVEAEDLTNEVYAVIARPAGPGPHPGLVVFHGGQNVVDEPEAVRWARRGYVAVAVELPGIADPDRALHSAGAWRYRPYNGFVWTANPTPRRSVLFEAVSAGLQGFELLRAEPGIDARRLGVMGWSWGGYTATMVSGILGERVAAGFSFFGSGFYEHTWFGQFLGFMPLDQRANWLTELDAGRRAPGIRAPFFFAAAANDSYFHPPAIEATAAVVPGGAGLLIAPNSDHQLWVPGGTGVAPGDTLAEKWFAHHLRSDGAGFPRVKWERNGAGGRVHFVADSPRTVMTATVFFSLPTPGGWPKRSWEEIPARSLGNGHYDAVIPARARGGDVRMIAVITDDRHVTVSTATAPTPEDSVAPEPPGLRLLSVGPPEADGAGGATTVLHEFGGEPGRAYGVEWSADGVDGPWVVLPDVVVGPDGRTRVRLRRADAVWPAALYFRITRR